LKRKPPPVLFVLPNLFTISSIFCGLYAIIRATDGVDPSRFYQAAVAILFGALFDSADGRVARMTKTQSDFGLQLDSLADVITFGLAPAVLIYKWALFHYGMLGLAVCFVFAACGALRLARFNVLAASAERAPKHFVGLPIPLAAASVVSLVLLHYRMAGGEELSRQPLMLVVVLVLAALMVSKVRYRTFKAVKARPRAVAPIILLAVLVLVAAWKTSFSLIFMILCTAFIALGPAEELLRLVRRLRLQHAIRQDEEEEEEEVI
jgi:CDP-diacylglycerol--serine O-phosphatidyltransferase